MKVIYEPEIEKHAPDLYLSDVKPNEPIAGWQSFDAAARERYASDGYLVVQRALTPEQVEAARFELQAMTFADEPRCESICFEGRIRDRLHRKETAANSATVESGQFTLGQAEEQMPELASCGAGGLCSKVHGLHRAPPAASGARLPAGTASSARALMEDTPVLYQEMAMLKPPQGREKPWHQDHAYFNFPLDTPNRRRMDRSRGCYARKRMYVRGSGRPFSRRKRISFAATGRSAIPTFCLCAERRTHERRRRLFFHSKLRTARLSTGQSIRWAVQYHYVPAGAALDGRIRMPRSAPKAKTSHAEYRAVISCRIYCGKRTSTTFVRGEIGREFYARIDIGERKPTPNGIQPEMSNTSALCSGEAPAIATIVPS